jgi:transcriptional regulator with PAS, ATPase and Fis domain
LRVLQEREIERIGSNKPVKIDIRVIAATNTNLDQAVQEGKFRQDLYFRLNVVPILLPPLRERSEDIPLLAKHFLNKFNLAFHKKITGFSDKAMDGLMRYHWPGNIRELENLIERIVVLSSRTEPIQLEDVPLEILMSPSQDVRGFDLPKVGLLRIREEFEKRMIMSVLEATRWNQTEAAKILKINRNSLLQKAKLFGISLKKPV